MSLPVWPHVLSGGSASRWRGLGTDFLVAGTEAGSMHLLECIFVQKALTIMTIETPEVSCPDSVVSF